MKAIDATSGLELARNLLVAETFWSRMRGLLGRSALPAGEGLWITSCNSVHTFGMKFPIDVLFLDKEKRVVAVAKALRPNRITPLYCRASSVIEVTAGTIDAANTVTGDHIEVVT